MAFSARSIRESENQKMANQERRQFFKLKSRSCFKPLASKKSGEEKDEQPFERQTAGVVSNLALANLNQDIEDIEVTNENQADCDQIKQMQEFLKNKDFARALISQLGVKQGTKEAEAKSPSEST